MPAAARWFTWAKHPAGPLGAVRSPSALLSTLTASAFTQTANGATSVTFTGTVKDAAGNAMAGLAGVTIEPDALETLGASSPYVTLSQSTMVSNGVDSTAVYITVQTVVDGVEVPWVGIPAASIVISVTGSGNTITQPASATNSAGYTTGSFVSTQAATVKTVSVAILGITASQQPTCETDGAAPPSGEVFLDTFETGALAAAQSGYQWGGADSQTAIAGTGTNGTFTRTSGSWPVDGFAGLLVYLETSGGGAVGPFTCTSNTATVLTFTGDATTAARMRDCDPRVVNTAAQAGTYSLEFRYGPDQTAVTDYSFSEQRFSYGEELGEVWMEYYLLVPTGYVHRDQISASDNNKFFCVVWATNYSGIDRCFVDIETNRNTTTGGSKLFVQVVDPVTASAYQVLTPQVNVSDVISPTGVIVPGTWARIRIHLKVASAAEANDGVIELWADTTQLYQKTDARIWYPSGSSLYGTTPFFKNGYLQGYCNSGFTAQTLIYIDNFRVYNADPSWTF